MSTESYLVEIPDELLPIIGQPDPSTRIFRQAGTKAESGKWFDAICEHIGATVSPGGVAMYAKVSRAGTYKRIKEGRLTAFCFHEIKPRLGLFGMKEVRTSPFIYIPVSEAKAWGEEMLAKRARGEKIYREDIEGEEPDTEGEFFEWDSPWRKKKIKEERGKPLR
jgi:hypothetical protein